MAVFDRAALAHVLKNGVEQLDLGLSAAQQEKLLDYLALLVRWNATYNLTAIRDPREMLVKHLLDSLAMQPYVRGLKTLADLGTGPGLPGIPLAIATPSLQVRACYLAVLIHQALREAVRQHGLPRPLCVLAACDGVYPFFDVDAVTARALATLPLILELGGHLLGADGRLAAMKGVVPEDEIAALPAGWRVGAVHPLRVPGLSAERHLLEIVRTRA